MKQAYVCSQQQQQQQQPAASTTASAAAVKTAAAAAATAATVLLPGTQKYSKPIASPLNMNACRHLTCTDLL
jgi:hypothetical protein